MSEQDFEAFLADSTRQFQEEQTAAELKSMQFEVHQSLRREILSSLHAELDRQGIPRYRDVDPMVERRLFDNHYRAIRSEQITQACAEGTNALFASYPDFDNYIKAKTEEVISEQTLHQGTTLAYVQEFLRLVSRYPDEDLSRAKKVCMAELLVCTQFELDHPLIRFFDSVTPGTGIQSMEEDIDYLLQAKAKFAEGEAYRDAHQQSVDESLAVLGIAEDDYRKRLKIDTLLIKCMDFTSNNEPDVRVQRGLIIHADLTELGITSPQLLQDFVTFVDQKFPLP